MTYPAVQEHCCFCILCVCLHMQSYDVINVTVPISYFCLNSKLIWVEKRDIYLC